MKRLIGGTVAIALALAGQLALARWLPALSMRLDLLLLVVVFFGVRGARVAAMLAGAVAGLLQDVWFGSLLGRNGFRKVLTGYLVATVGSKFALEHALSHAIALALATLVDHSAGVAAGLLLGVPLADPFDLLVWERAGANALAGTAVYALLGRFRTSRRERRAERARRVTRRFWRVAGRGPGGL